MSATPSHLRRANQRAVLDRLLREGPATRAGLAAALGMSAPTAGKVIDDLLSRGVLEEFDPEPSPSRDAGRPGRPLRLATATPRVALVHLDVGWTRFAAAPPGAAPGGEAEWELAFPTGDEPETWRNVARAARRALGRRFPGGPWGVVASVPGLVDEAAARVLFSPNLHWTEGDTVAVGLADAWRVPVCVVQEIRALALGHHVATGADDFLLVDAGEGVGGAAVIGGRLHEAALPMSGELGHTPVLGNARPCGCGGRGCLETLLSRRGLLRTLREAEAGRPTWRALRQRVEARGVEPWLGPTLDAAAAGVAGAVNVLGVRRVVLTGTLAEMGEAVVAALGERVGRASMWARFGDVVVEAAPRRRGLGLLVAGLQRLVCPTDERERQSVYQAEQRTRSVA